MDFRKSATNVIAVPVPSLDTNGLLRALGVTFGRMADK